MEDQFDKTGNKIGEKEVQRKIYPGYGFVKMGMNDNTWYIVRNTRGCTGWPQILCRKTSILRFPPKYNHTFSLFPV